MSQIRDQILDNRHMRQRVDFDIALGLIHAVDTGQRVNAVDVHRAAAADTFATRPPERQCWINIAFDLDQRVQNHRTTGVHVHEIRVQTRVLVVVRPP